MGRMQRSTNNARSETGCFLLRLRFKLLQEPTCSHRTSSACWACPGSYGCETISVFSGPPSPAAWTAPPAVCCPDTKEGEIAKCIDVRRVSVWPRGQKLTEVPFWIDTPSPGHRWAELDGARLPGCGGGGRRVWPPAWTQTQQWRIVVITAYGGSWGSDRFLTDAKF